MHKEFDIEWNKVESELKGIASRLERVKFLRNLYEKTTPLVLEMDELDKRKNLSKDEKERLKDLKSFLFDYYETGDGTSLIYSFSKVFNVPTLIHRYSDLGQSEIESSNELSLVRKEYIEHFAQQRFDIIIQDSEFQAKISQPNPENVLAFLEGRLGDIEARENIKRKYLVSGKRLEVPDYRNEIEREAFLLLNMERGVFNDPVLIESITRDCIEVQIYCDHWILKPYLEGLKMELEQQNDILSDDRIEPQLQQRLLLLLQKENLLIPGMPLKDVYNHFKPFLDYDGTKYLTLEQLIQFIEDGFTKTGKVKRQKMTIPPRDSLFILMRFHELYRIAADEYGHTRKLEPYRTLVKRCFSNWTEQQIKDGLKAQKSGRIWVSQ